MGPSHPRRLVLKESLEGRYLLRLCRPRLSFKFLQRLPAKPTEFVVVPHVHEGATCACVLKVWVMQVRPVRGPIAAYRRWDVEIPNLFSVRIPDDVSQSRVVHPLR